jgi:hypothetical protein
MLIEYKPCTFVRKGKSKEAFVPSIHAKVGKKLKLRENGSWSGGWKVTESGKAVAKTQKQIDADPGTYWKAQTDIG